VNDAILVPAFRRLTKTSTRSRAWSSCSPAFVVFEKEAIQQYQHQFRLKLNIVVHYEQCKKPSKLAQKRASTPAKKGLSRQLGVTSSYCRIVSLFHEVASVDLQRMSSGKVN